MADHTVTWHDGGRAPTQPADRRYPNGIDMDASGGAARRCTVALRYPAPRIGHHVVECRTCGLSAVVTTAGRADDPKSLTVACQPTDADA